MTRRGAVVAALGVTGTALGGWFAPRDALLGWMAVHREVAGIAFGSLCWLAIAELAPMTWFAALRPAARALAWLSVPALVGWLPVAVSPAAVYSWVAAPDRPHAVTVRDGWLSGPAFAARTIAVLALFSVLAALARRERPVGWSLATLLLGGPAWCLFAFDAWMTLEPDWKSSVYAFIAFGSALRDALAAILVLGALRDRAELPTLPPDVWHALGRLLLTCLLLDAYLQYSQLIIVWIGGIPLEIGWYADRWRGAAKTASWALVLGTGALCAALLSLDLKRSRGAMTVVAAGVLVLGLLEASWDVLPHAQGDPMLFLAAAALAWLGVVVATVGMALREPDPDREASLAYRST